MHVDWLASVLATGKIQADIVTSCAIIHGQLCLPAAATGVFNKIETI